MLLYTLLPDVYWPPLCTGWSDVDDTLPGSTWRNVNKSLLLHHLALEAGSFAEIENKKKGINLEH